MLQASDLYALRVANNSCRKQIKNHEDTIQELKTNFGRMKVAVNELEKRKTSSSQEDLSNFAKQSREDLEKILNDFQKNHSSEWKNVLKYVDERIEDTTKASREEYAAMDWVGDLVAASNAEMAKPINNLRFDVTAIQEQLNSILENSDQEEMLPPKEDKPSSPTWQTFEDLIKNIKIEIKDPAIEKTFKEIRDTARNLFKK